MHSTRYKAGLIVAFSILLGAWPILAGDFVWTNEGGPYGGRVYAVEYIDGSTLLAGTEHGGVYISHDSGDTWQTANEGLTSYIVNCIGKNPLNSNTVYIGTSGNGVFRTRNGTSACTWSERSTNLGSNMVLSIAVSSVDTCMIYAGTVNGIYVATDCGGYWSDITNNISDPNVSAIALGPSGLDTLYVGTNSGVFKSTDGGVSWA
ncbi:MAG: hypothetical protein ABFR50_10955, partial [Candidatus Fermentibacteria bacterium]